MGSTKNGGAAAARIAQEKNANKNHVLKLELCVPSLYKFPISPFYSNIFNPCIEQCPFYSDTYSLLLPQAKFYMDNKMHCESIIMLGIQ